MAKFSNKLRSAFYQGFTDQNSLVLGPGGSRTEHGPLNNSRTSPDIADQIEPKWSMNPCLLLTLPNHQYFLHLGRLSGRELNYGHIQTKREIVSVGEFHYFHRRE